MIIPSGFQNNVDEYCCPPWANLNDDKKEGNIFAEAFVRIHYETY